MNNTIIQSTPFGPVGILWSVFEDLPRIVRVLLSAPGASAGDRIAKLYPDSRTSSCAEIDSVAESIKGFLEGQEIHFSLDVARMSLCPAFQQSVLRAEHGIPRGRVSTYQLIAAHVGKPGAARAVGNALAKNPFPIIVPCHRAIRSDGHPGGFQGGLDMKRSLLSMEGIAFDRNGRVLSRTFHYEETG